MIERLTQKQIDTFPRYVEEGLKIGLSCEPMDRERAKEAIIQCYKNVGLKPPEIFVYLASPWQGSIAASLLGGKDQDREQVSEQVRDQVRADVWNQVRDHVWNQVWNQVWDQVWDQVSAQVWDQVSAQVWDQVWADVWNQVRDHVWNQVWNQVWDQVWDQVSAQVWDQVWAQVMNQVRTQIGDHVWDEVNAQVGMAIYGSLDIQWLIFYQFFRRECGLKNETEQMQGLFELAKHAGWCWPFENVCIITDRPEVIKFNTAKQLHCMTGPAIKYRDGFSVYSISGVKIPPKYFEKPIDPSEVLKETSSRIRMALMRKVGYEPFIHSLNGKLVDEKPSTRGSSKPCQLWEVDLPDIGKTRLLKVTWHDTKEEQETFLPVPVTREEFADTFGVVPTDINNAELVRLATMRIDTSKYDIVHES